jgi:CRISPR-associated protein Cas6
MFWSDDETTPVGNADVIDITFKANAKCLPVDHAYALSSAILKILPWVKDEPHAGIHLMYGADSGNGWERPENKNELVYLSRRTRFGIRVPKSRQDEVIEKLTNATLDVADNQLKLENPHLRELIKHSAIYSRNVVTDNKMPEEDFLQYAQTELKAMGIISKKIMGRKAGFIEHPDGKLPIRSLLLVELNDKDSLELQANGLGNYKFMGCGIFLPHKTVESQKIIE